MAFVFASRRGSVGTPRVLVVYFGFTEELNSLKKILSGFPQTAQNCLRVDKSDEK